LALQLYWTGDTVWPPSIMACASLTAGSGDSALNASMQKCAAMECRRVGMSNRPFHSGDFLAANIAIKRRYESWGSADFGQAKSRLPLESLLRYAAPTVSLYFIAIAAC
jgi:hypothetical protein